MFEEKKDTGALGSEGSTVVPDAQVSAPDSAVIDRSPTNLHETPWSTFCSLVSQAFTKELFLGGGSLGIGKELDLGGGLSEESVSNDVRVESRGVFGTIASTIALELKEAPVALCFRVFTAAATAAMPLGLAWMTGQVASTVQGLSAAALGIVGAVALPAVYSFGMDLINRTNSLFNSAEARRHDRLAHRLHAEVLASWSFEDLENGEKHAASKRFLRYALRLFALSDNIVNGASSVASAGAAAVLVAMIDWRLSAIAVGFIGLRMMRDTREAKNSFSLEKRLQGIRQLNDTLGNITSDPTNVRESNLVDQTSDVTDRYQEGAHKIHGKELLNETRNQFTRLILDSIPALIIGTGVAMLTRLYQQGIFSIASVVSQIGYLWNLGSQCRAVGFQVGQIAQNQIFAADALDFLATMRLSGRQKNMPLRFDGAPRIIVDNAKVVRGQRCLLDIPNLVIEPGEIIGIVGQEGAGKSVFVRTLLGLIHNSSGMITYQWDEGSIAMSPELGNQRRESLQYVRYFNQDIRPFAGLTLRQLLEFGRARGREDKEHSVERTIEVCRLKEILDHTPAGLESRWGSGYPNGVQFNGGAAKQFLLGMVFKANLPILVLDESTANLSAETGGAILNDIIAEARKSGQTVIVVSHNWSNFAAVDRILAIDEGKIVQDGKPDDLIKEPGYYQEGLVRSFRESAAQLGLDFNGTNVIDLLLGVTGKA